MTIPTWAPEALVIFACIVLGAIVYEALRDAAAFLRDLGDRDEARLDDLEDR